MAPILDDPTQPNPRPPWWLGDLVAATLVIAISFAPLPEDGQDGGHPVFLWLVVAAAGVLPLRRRWPLQVLAGCIALYAIAAVMGTAAQGVALATAIAMYSAAYRMHRPWTLLVGGLCIMLIVAFTLIAAFGNLFDPRVVQFALMIGLGTAVGDATRSRRDFIAAAQERVKRAEQTREAEAQRRVTEERLRIARDLHDTVAHQISVISLNAGVASSVLATSPDKAKEALGTVRRASRTVLGEIGDLLAWLRSNDQQAELAPPQPSLAELDQLIARFREAGMHIDLTLMGDPARLTDAVDLVAYRIVQEGLTNADRHGVGRRAEVQLCIGTTQAEITIANPAVPAVERTRPDGTPSGYGLVGLQERVAAVRGTVETSHTLDGYLLSASLPLAVQEVS